MKWLVVSFTVVQCCLAMLNGTIDLGYGFDQGTVYWPGMLTFNLTEVLRGENPYMLAKEFAAAEHGGTHLDAPLHFNPSGWSVADIPIERLIVPGVVIEMHAAAANDSDLEVTKKDLEDWEKANGPLPYNVTVLFNFDWAKKYLNKTEYLGMINENDSELHFPGISKEAAEWLVKSGKVVGVGVDTASVDRGINKEFIAHQVLTAANIYLMENLDLNDFKLPPRGFQLLVMPMKIVNGTGAPLRIFARPEVEITISIFSRVTKWFRSVWMVITNVFN